MTDDKELPGDAITSEKINATTLPGHAGDKPLRSANKRNAFTELMSSPQKPKVKPTSKALLHRAIPTLPPNAPFTGRNGLGAYMASPTKFPAVIYHNEDFVAIYDGFPKSSVHVLLLPLNPEKTLLHPFKAFEDPQFIASVKAEVRKLKSLVASELRRLYGKDSASEQTRIKAMETDPPPEALPPGRDWEKQVLTGIHSGPSMNHLHIHVLSVDRYSSCLKHKKHYNSFATPFLVDVEDFPLDPEDVRRHPGGQGYLKSDLICWRCQQNFKSSFTSLKQHLAQEYEEWKRE
ncbi:aprataxin-like protein [Xylographa opegraphella]|nr:aprataxin-like protein [Xylographa opegraphella]